MTSDGIWPPCELHTLRGSHSLPGMFSASGYHAPLVCAGSLGPRGTGGKDLFVGDEWQWEWKE